MILTGNTEKRRNTIMHKKDKIIHSKHCTIQILKMLLGKQVECKIFLGYSKFKWHRKISTTY